MLFAKIKEKLLNRRNDIEISEITDDSGTPLDAEKMFALLSKVSFPADNIISFGNSTSIIAGNFVGGILCNEDDWLVLTDGLSAIRDGDDNPLIPLENNAGKVFAVNEDEDGLVAVEKGTKLYLHSVYFNSDAEYLYLIDYNENPITTYQEFLSHYTNRITCKYNSTNYPDVITCNVDSGNLWVCYPEFSADFQSAILKTYNLDLNEGLIDTVTPL